MRRWSFRRWSSRSIDFTANWAMTIFYKFVLRNYFFRHYNYTSITIHQLLLILWFSCFWDNLLCSLSPSTLCLALNVNTDTKTTNTELKIHKYKVRKHTNTDRKPPQIQKYKEENHTNPAGLKIQPRLLQPCVSPCILCRQLQLPIHPDVKLLQMVRFVGALAPISPWRQNYRNCQIHWHPSPPMAIDSALLRC